MSDESLNRFNRIVSLYIQLQSSRVVKAQDMADRFGVSVRTIYRDIRSLEAAGVPIAGEAGLGYSIMDGYRLPPVMFTREEASSFVAAEKLMQSFMDRKLGAHFESAMFKIRSVLRGHARDQFSTLTGQIRINTPQRLFNETAPDALEVLLDSIGNRTQVRLTYQASAREQQENRMIEPVGIFHENHYWYVMAYCHLRKDYRQFRTDRMTGIERSKEPFTMDHPEMDVLRSPDRPCPGTRIIIRVQKDVVRHIQSGKKYYGFVEETDRGDVVDMTFQYGGPLYAFARWYIMFGDCARILEPAELRSVVGTLIDKMLTGLEDQEAELASNPVSSIGI